MRVPSYLPVVVAHGLVEGEEMIPNGKHGKTTRLLFRDEARGPVLGVLMGNSPNILNATDLARSRRRIWAERPTCCALATLVDDRTL